MARLNKTEVFDPIGMFNTIGQELENIIEAKGKNKSEFLEIVNWDNFESITKVTNTEIKKIQEFLNLSSEINDFIKKFQAEYNDTKKKTSKSYKASVRSYRKLRSVIPLLGEEFNDGIDQLEDITDFFNVDSENDIFIQSKDCEILFKQQNTVDVDPINLKAWLRRGEIDFGKFELPEYNVIKLKEWIDARNWNRYFCDKNYFFEIPNILKKFGVGVVYIPFLPKTVYGAIRWINNRPLIMVSDRNRDLATCWLTLFHELGHVILHKDCEIFEGQINEPKYKTTEREKEANKFANYYLFNGDHLRKEIFKLKSQNQFIDAQALCRKYSINEMFVAYWLKKAQCATSINTNISICFSK